MTTNAELPVKPNFVVGTQFKIAATYGHKPIFEVQGIRDIENPGGLQYDCIDVNEKAKIGISYCFAQCNFDYYAAKGSLQIIQ